MGFELVIDLQNIWDSFLAFGQLPPAVIIWRLFIGGGWIFLLLLLISSFYNVWLGGRKKQFASKWNFVLLAIDIPRNNEQTLKAVESIFASLAAGYSGGNLLDKWWFGKVQESFSFEIVSLEGYIQFLVRSPEHFRDLVEAAIYAQYPEAEITEVDDYAKQYEELKFPNEKMNLWGSEFVFTKDYPYPLRTYTEFEYGLTGVLADPLAGLLEVMSRFGAGEQLWLQFVITPQKPDWGGKAKKVMAELVGESYDESNDDFKTKIISMPSKWMGNFHDIVVKTISPNLYTESVEKEEKKPEFKMHVGRQSLAERVYRKLTKHVFKISIRLIYFGEKEVFNKGRGVAAVIGAIQQYNSADANGLKPGKKSKTGADYFNVAKRIAGKQNQILGAYINRAVSVENEEMLIGTEELASLWHFPMLDVKAPAVEKISSRKVVPPSRLPFATATISAEEEILPEPSGIDLPTEENMEEEPVDEEPVEEPVSEEPIDTIPPNLPVG